MRTGTIPINKHGVTVDVQYRFDPATDEYKLEPNLVFTRQDIERVMKDMPNLILAWILVNETEKYGKETVKQWLKN